MVSRFDEKIDSDDLTGSVSHLIVYCHGFGSSGSRHGAHIKSEIDSSLGPSHQVYICKSNSGWTGLMTFFKTCEGLDVGGLRIQEEIISVISRHRFVKEISFIGSSLGGLYARFAIGHLFGETASPLRNKITPVAYISLATPHLGVRGLYSNSLLTWLTPTSRQLMLNDASDFPSSAVCKLASPPFTDGLSAFSVLIAYVPLLNDGIVAHPSASIGLPAPPCIAALDSEASTCLRTPRAAPADEPVDLSAFALASDFAAAEALRAAAARLRAAGRWHVVEVGVDHKRLATLYPGDRRRPCPWTPHIVRDIISHLAPPGEGGCETNPATGRQPKPPRPPPAGA